MKTLARMMLIFLAGRIAQGADKVDNKLPVVFASVRFNIGEPPAPTVSCAEGLASLIFAKAGVHVIWYSGLPTLLKNTPKTVAGSSAPPKGLASSSPDSWRAAAPFGLGSKGQPILIDIAPNASETFHQGALAYARAFDGVHITIFWDRVRIANDPRKTTVLLAHVLVHEMTHVLQGTHHHSAEGIMKAHWTDGDIYDMAWKPLSFDPEDVELIRLGLAGRSNIIDRGFAKVSPIHDSLQTGTNDK